MNEPLPDALERERATTTFDRNVVVTAGAGTGKTRLLVDRLIHLLMRDSDMKLTDIVALTFTNKAASEIKLRLRERLEAFIAVRLEADVLTAAAEESRSAVRALMERYHLSKDQLNRRAAEALRQIERSEIGTIHSFAATLLRLYPMQSGVDPQFLEDDGSRFELIFNEMWSVWLDQELARSSNHTDEWKRALRLLQLDQLRGLAFALCSETVDLGRLKNNRGELPPAISDWLRSLIDGASEMLDRHRENRSNEKLLRAAREALETFLRTGAAAPGKEDDDPLDGGINKNLKGWRDEEAEQAQEILRIAKGLRQADDEFSGALVELLTPFVENFRSAYASAGFVSFDGLLARARSLVCDHSHVREQLKRRFKTILIDEFQDTDPTQYEILLYLAEEIGRSAKDWRSVKLARGKIFVVGDPKQSIYAFRRADIQAYLEVVEKIIKAQDGVECRLTTNFRSHGRILGAVNGIFERLMLAKEGLQPPYIAIAPAPRDREDALPFRRVAIRKVAGSQRIDNDRARRLEAESLARWLGEEVLGKAELIDQGGARKVEPKDVALLFRKLTDIHYYIEPLRRRGIRYVVEGERHFYAVQEVIDAVNLLRGIDDPHDRLALVGVLRSPLGGLADAAIYDLHRRRLLDYTAAVDLLTPESVRELYGILTRLNREIRTLPVGEALERVFASLPVRPLAAASFHGEQAVANLEKLRLEAEIMGREPLSTFKEVVARLASRVLRIEEEAESALAEENLDAVRILSIHKSKGLEFPVVVLAGCHTVPNQGGEREPCVLQDWSSGLAGLHVGSCWSVAGVFIAQKARLREREEQKRVLYVAMTRAREHLTISCAAIDKRVRGSYLAMLEDALGETTACGEEPRLLEIGGSAIELSTAYETLTPPVRARAATADGAAKFDAPAYAAMWKKRGEEMDARSGASLFLSPTLLKRREAELAEAVPEKEKLSIAAELPLRIGELAHRFLEYWDFGRAPAGFEAELAPFLDRWVAAKWRPSRLDIERELQEILTAFFASPPYSELQSVRILGREIPLLLQWQDAAVMEGVIDLLYERDAKIFIADYKSDRVEPHELAELVAHYHHQVEIYSEAVRRTVKKDVAGFKLIFLRLGRSVEALNV
ncbi:MAG TPA: UvrD-helicase domain-containing protein [Verrucomicrobiae bacterium]|nr:UvrD-helicase domain-containing protein [Verrucomicrobiae bacterium]